MVTLDRAKQIVSERTQLVESEPTDLTTKIGDVLRNFNTGLTRTLSIPRALSDVNEKLGGTIFGNIGRKKESEDINLLPTAEQMQGLGSKAGITFPPGEEPETLTARTIQNIGSAAPILAALPLSPAIVGTEILASFAGAGGGKLLEQTEFGEKHPELARGIGELSGGVGSVLAIPIAKFLLKGGSVRALFNYFRSLLPGSEKRMLNRLRDIEARPDIALKGIKEAQKTPEGRLLLPGQAAGTPGLARLTKTVEEEVPRIAAIIERKRIRNIAELQKRFTKTGDVADARMLLEERLALRAEQATKALSKIDKVDDATTLSRRVEKILVAAEKEATDDINNLWRNLPSAIRARGDNLNMVMRRELENITEGGNIAQISAEARRKLGVLKKIKETKDFELVGGSLFNPKKVTAPAKAIHQFYSLLGFERQRLSRIGGQGNKIRIINDLREAVLKDLDIVGAGEKYREALTLTKDFHDKFTKGAIGRILGRARGETPSPVKSLEEIVGRGGVTAKENIQQALKASPKTKKQIEDFLKLQFGVIVKNTANNKINVRAGNKFVDDFSNILDDIFPELKRDLQDAIKRQADVDDFIGVAQVSELSPLLKNKTAAAFFLGNDPGTEMAALLRNKTLQRTNFLSDLVKITKTDPTGKAFKGLQNAFTEEVLKIGNIDDIRSLSGTKMLSKLSDLKKTVLKANLFSEKEYNRMEIIADTFKKIEIEIKAKPFQEGIIADLPSKLLQRPLQILAARAGGQFGAQSIGGSLQTAGFLSSDAKMFAQSLIRDEPRAYLIAMVLDKNKAKDALTKLSKLRTGQRIKLFDRIKDEARKLGTQTVENIKRNIPRVPVSGITPAAGTLAEEISSSTRDIESDNRLKEFKRLKDLL